MRILERSFLLVSIICVIFFTLNKNIYAQNIIQFEEKSVETDDTSKALTEEEKEELKTTDRPVDVSDSSKIKIQLFKSVQKPSSKEVDFALYLKSTIDSDRVKVTWQVKGVSIHVGKEELVTNLTVNKDTVYSVPLIIKPLGRGVSEIFVTVEVFEANAKNLATARKIFESNSKGEVLPFSEEYNSAKVRYNIFMFFIYIIGGALGLFVLFLILKKIKSWYNADDVKNYDAKYRNVEI